VAEPTDTGVPCPASVPRYLLPGGGSPQFGANQPLFSRPVTSVVVCSYGTTTQALGRHPPVPARLPLHGTLASRLVAGLEKPSAASCAAPTASLGHPLAIIGLAADGSKVATVTATLSADGCAVQVTNGTALRRNWTPPRDLRNLLLALTPRLGGDPVPMPSHTPSGKVHGSPISS
jgi:hypothetical protein